MRAQMVREIGGPDLLRVERTEPPSPDEGEVQLEVGACALNHLDLDILRGVSRLETAFPFIPGFEVVGTISELGEGVTDWNIGDRVAPKTQIACGTCAYCVVGRQSLCEAEQPSRYSGGLAELFVCSASQLVRLPDEVAFENAVAIQAAFGTAWHMLFSRGALKAGETVLVNAVGSGVGSAAVQLAKWAGARVLGTASTNEKLEHAEQIGLDHGINYSEIPEFSIEVRRLTAGRGVDLVIEHVGGNAFLQGVESLKKGGRLVTCGAHAGEVVPFDIIPFFRDEKVIIGSRSSVVREFQSVLELAREGVISPVVDSIFPLERADEAFLRLESRRAFGKVVVTP